MVENENGHTPGAYVKSTTVGNLLKQGEEKVHVHDDISKYNKCSLLFLVNVNRYNSNRGFLLMLQFL